VPQGAASTDASPQVARDEHRGARLGAAAPESSVSRNDRVMRQIAGSPDAGWLSHALAQALSQAGSEQKDGRLTSRKATAAHFAHRLTPLARSALVEVVEEVAKTLPPVPAVRESMGGRIARWMNQGWR
jgi:hypothetical protein